MKKNKKNKTIIIIISIFLVILFSSIVYSAFSSTMTITGNAHARVETNVRITDFRLASSNNSTSSYEDFGKNHISTNLDLKIRLVYVQATTLGTEISGNEKLVKVASGDLNTIGSEICIDKECFYLINNDGYTVTMLAKYNLYVGGSYDGTTWTAYGDEATGIQHHTMIGFEGYDKIRNGVIKFAETSYWTNETNHPLYVFDSRANGYQYVKNYQLYLEGLGITIKDARLIKIDDFFEMGCDFINNNCEYPWIFSTSYHTGSSYNRGDIWVVFSDGRITPNQPMYHNGVRPVIEIPLTEF